MKMTNLFRRANRIFNPPMPPGYTGSMPVLGDWPVARSSRPPSRRR